MTIPRPAIIVFALALAVRLLFLLDVADMPSFDAPIVDAGAYDTTARQLAATGEATSRLFWQPFLYPFMLAGIYLLTDGSIIAAKIIQAMLGAVICVLVWFLAHRRLGATEAWIAAGIMVLYGPLLLFESELLATGLAAFWAVVLVLLLDVVRVHPQPRWWLALGATSALAVLTRPTFVPAVLASWLWIAWLLWREAGGWRRPALAVACAIASFAALATPVAKWNGLTTGRLSFLPSSGGINLHIGNNPDVCSTTTIRPGIGWTQLVERPVQEGAATASERNGYFRRQVTAYAADEPVAFLGGLGRKVLQLVGSREIPRNLDVYLTRQWSIMLSALTWKVGPFGFPFGVLLPLAVLGVVFSWRRIGLPLLLVVLPTAAAVVLVFVAARYRLPLVPLLAVCASAGVTIVIDALRRRDQRRLAAAAGIALLIVLLATVPGPFCEEEVNMEADYWACLGHSFAERGRFEDSVAAYRHSLDADPEQADVSYNLGRFASQAGDLEDATQLYRRASEIDPEFAATHTNLGSVLLRQGRVDEALTSFRAAIARDPDFELATQSLALTLLQTGDAAGALEVIERYIREHDATPRNLAIRGTARQQLGDLSGALDDLRAAVAGGAVDPETRNELGTALLGSGDPAAALVEFEAAAAADPSHARAASNAGVALAMQSRLREAADRFAEAVRRDPDMIDARVNLARALGQLGDLEGAQRELAAIVERQPNHPQDAAMF